MMTREVAGEDWDVIVIGTGMGGGTLGYALAKAGKRVLYVEQGRRTAGYEDTLAGDFAETFFPTPGVAGAEHADLLRRAGRCVDSVVDRSAGARRFVPFIGAGVGGSSALYGAALERLHPCDFTPGPHFPNVGGHTLPQTWPIDYTALRPYYQKAEALFKVKGTLDPLRGDHLDPLPEPPPMSRASHELFEFFRAQGLHPYRLPNACEYIDGCVGCQGFLCPNDCKKHSGNICLEPAVRLYGAAILDECRVERLEANEHRVTGVVCRRGNEAFTLRAETVIVSAGALETPSLLLKSRNMYWPNGLANASGLVGRNLMRHYVDLFVVFPKERFDLPGNLKELALNDFYFSAGRKLGTVQSFGALPPVTIIAAQLHQDVLDGFGPWIAQLFRLGMPFLRQILDRRFSRAVILASITEDLPYADNRVVLDDVTGTTVIEFHIREHEKRRIKAMRRKLSKALKPYKFMLIKQAENNERLAHACGTCRFGATAHSSVLDPDNRAHGVDNLYVVDSSFFPSSAGANPGLTIAANALRVADIILRRLDHQNV